MQPWLLSTFLTAQSRPDGDLDWYTLLPIIVLIALSALSSWLKSRQNKNKKPPPRPSSDRPQPSAQSRKLPSYARGRQGTSPPPASSTTPAPRTVSRPQPPRRPTTQPTPATRVPAPRPTTSTPRPRTPQPAQAPKTVKRTTAAPKPTARRVQKPAPAQAAKALTAHLAGDRGRAKKQITSSRKAAQLQLAVQSEPSPVIPSPGQPLQAVLSNRRGLAQAIVLAEILGTPMGLRPKGSFDRLC